MDVQIEEINPVKKILHIEVPQDQVQEELDKSYRELQKTAKIKGFRAGKIPRSVLEQFFGKKVNADITAKLIQESYIEVINNHNLKILGQPQIDPKPLNSNMPLQYDITVELYPKLDDIDYKGLKLKKNIYTVSPEDIDRQLADLQQKVKRHQPIEENRPLREGDVAMIEFEGLKDGVPQIRSDNYGLIVGKSEIDPVFDENLIGMNIGDQKQFTVNFPPDHPKLPNAEIAFTVTLKEIRQEIIPEINDEFAKIFGGYETLNDFKQRIAEDMAKALERRSEHEVNEQIFAALLGKTNFQVPEILINHELSVIIQDIENNLANQNTSLEKEGVSVEALRARYWDTALAQAQRYILLKKLIEQEKFELSEQEINEGMEMVLKASSGTIDEIKNFYAQNPEQLANLKQMQLEKKMMNHLIQSSEIETVPAS